MKKIIISNFLLFLSLSICAQSNLENSKKKGSLPESLMNIDFNQSLSLDKERFTNLPLKIVIGTNNSGIILGVQSCIFGVNQQIGHDQSNVINEFEQLTGTYVTDAIYSNSNAYNLNRGIALRLGYQKSIVKGLYASLSGDFCQIKADIEHTYLMSYYYSWSGSEYYSTYNTYDENTRYIGWRLNAGIGYTISLGKAKRFYLNTEFVYAVIDNSKSLSARMNFMSGIGFRIGTPAKTTYEGIRDAQTIPIQR
jgi:hypothetical protein